MLTFDELNIIPNYVFMDLNRVCSMPETFGITSELVGEDVMSYIKHMHDILDRDVIPDWMYLFGNNDVLYKINDLSYETFKKFKGACPRKCNAITRMLYMISWGDLKKLFTPVNVYSFTSDGEYELYNGLKHASIEMCEELDLVTVRKCSCAMGKNVSYLYVKYIKNKLCDAVHGEGDFQSSDPNKLRQTANKIRALANTVGSV